MDGHVKPYKSELRKSIVGWAVRNHHSWQLHEGEKRPDISDNHWIIPAYISEESNGLKWWLRKE